MFIMLFNIEQGILAEGTLANYGNSLNPPIFPSVLWKNYGNSQNPPIFPSTWYRYAPLCQIFANQATIHSTLFNPAGIIFIL